MTALRASTWDGGSYDDPSDADLYRLLTDLDQDDEDAPYFIIDRLGRPEFYAQVMSMSGTLLVEHREGSADQHFHVFESDLRTVHRGLAAWSHESAGWRTALDWQPGMP
ncbi:MAG: hypothetical protein GEU94_20355 [Micromonosporaceae bacterium]|nr:hypothetical protein [Micromonosporaceae bacterium]